MKPAAEGRKSFLLRMDPGLWRELEAWAQQEMRSVNGQIEYLLKRAVVRRRGEGESDGDEGRSGRQEGMPGRGPEEGARRGPTRKR